jgi:hypothetical protein
LDDDLDDDDATDIDARRLLAPGGFDPAVDERRLRGAPAAIVLTAWCDVDLRRPLEEGIG